MRIRRSCPICQTSVDEKWTWIGILEAIFFFPCGIYCCVRRKVMFCPNCNIDVIVADGSVPRLVHTYKYYKEYVLKDNFHNQRTVTPTSVDTISTSIRSP